MADWDSNQYLKFKKQRTQPAIDLAMRVIDRAPKPLLISAAAPETVRLY